MAVAKFGANFLLNDFKGVLTKCRVKVGNCGVSKGAMASLMILVYCGLITHYTARQVLEEWINSAKCK